MSNQPVCLESTVNLFSGTLVDFDEKAVMIRYQEGTHGIFLWTHVVGFVESEILEKGENSS